MVKPIKLHLPWLLWLGIITLLSLTPGGRLPKIEFNWFSIDICVHFTMYSVLCFLVLIGYFHQKNELSNQLIAWSIGSIIAFGLMIEFLQGNFIYQRFFSWNDFFANSVGVLLGWMAFIVFKKKELNLVRFLQ